VIREHGLTADLQRSRLRFIDLFAGLGGFHVALTRLGHQCVFAAEIDRDLQELYRLNFGMRPASDIRFCWKDVPDHDVLCAGFPCQPFSKAGSQSGFTCPDSGDLFEYILKIVDRHSPEYLLLENVPNILRHAQGETWRRIRESLQARGYEVSSTEISPHQIGIPQIRNRALIVACRSGLEGFEWPMQDGESGNLHISSVLDEERECQIFCV
jgi:DNA (cytosine-5)-methyltransferase 1